LINKPQKIHVRVAELVLGKSHAVLVEDKQDVIILMDSITRLARAYNLVISCKWKNLKWLVSIPAALYRS